MPRLRQENPQGERMTPHTWAILAFIAIFILICLLDRYIWWPKREDEKILKVIEDLLNKHMEQAEHLHRQHPDWTAEQLVDAILSKEKHNG